MGSTHLSVEYEPEGHGADSRVRSVCRILFNRSAAGLLVWLAILGTFVVALRALSDPGTIWRNTLGHLLLDACGMLLAVCAVYCLWVEYRVSTERRILLATVAFAGLAASQLIHGLSALMPQGHRILEDLAHQYSDVWQILAAFLLVSGARSGLCDDRQNCRRTGLNVMLGCVILSICLAAAVFGLGKLWPRIMDVFPGLSEAILHAGRWLSLTFITHALSLAASIVALLVFARYHIEHEDSFSNAVTACLLLLITSQAASLLSASRGDLIWWASHAFGVSGLLVLLVRLGAEFGKSYADAHARIEHLEAVHYMSSRLSTTLDIRVVLLALVSDTASMLSARFASIMLADNAGETLTTMAVFGLPELPLNPREPQKVEGSGRPAFYSGHAARAFREKRVCVVDDVYTDVEFVPWRLLSKYDGYAVSVPLVYHEIALGVINLFFEKHVPLNDERIRLFQTLASAAAVAIANAQLYDSSLQAHGSNADDADMPPSQQRLAS